MLQRILSVNCVDENKKQKLKHIARRASVDGQNFEEKEIILNYLPKNILRK